MPAVVQRRERYSWIALDIHDGNARQQVAVLVVRNDGN